MEEIAGQPEALRHVPKAMLFDLDDTLAPSFKPPSESMIAKLSLLLDRMPVAIVTAAGLPRIEAGFLHRILPSRKFPLYILANGSAECFVFQNGEARLEYEHLLTEGKRSEIKRAIEESVAEVGLPPFPGRPSETIDRSALIAFAALGTQATEEEKRAWDPDKSKRRRLKAALDKRLPGYEVLIGGKTTIDITIKGMTKAYGVNWLAKELRVQPAEMLYVGDAFDEDGNDAAVIPTGIETKKVSEPSETELIIDDILAR